MIGIFLKKEILLLQCIQKDLGETIDKPLGILYIITFKKLPKITPNRKDNKCTI